jgi:glutathione S-transferase
MLSVYGDVESGNCYKVKLLLELLGLEHRWTKIDITKGESRTPEFLAMNSNGRVPLLTIAPGVHLPESNAILCYLADGTDYLPGDRLLRAQVMQWLFFEQYSHEPFIATSRYWLHFLKDPVTYRDKLAEKRPGGLSALKVMESHLQHRPYLVGDRYTIADIALYAYTHVADEGGFSLEEFPAIRAWLKRVAAHPRHFPMRNP